MAAAVAARGKAEEALATVPDGAGRKRRMHYFFAVVEDLVTGGDR